MVGYNYRMTNIQAAIGLAQMERVGTALTKRREMARWYNEALASLTWGIDLPTESHWAGHVYWMYNIFLKDSDEARRDSVMKLMDQAGIETRPVFYPMHVMPPYFEDRSYPIADDWARRGINLPSHEGLTREDVYRVAGALESGMIETASANMNPAAHKTTGHNLRAA